MQGRGHNIFEQSDKIAAFQKKIKLWVNHLSKDRLDMFPSACHEVQQLDTAAKNDLKKPSMRILLNFELGLTTTSLRNTEIMMHRHGKHHVAKQRSASAGGAVM